MLVAPMSEPLTPANESRLSTAAGAGPAAVELLRAAGCRPTPQRLLVLQALGSGEHLSADDVLAHARKRSPAVNRSTVYRALEALVEAGLVRENDLGLGRLHYELARDHLHHHAVCVRCGAVAHLHAQQLEPLAAALEAGTGYRLPPERELAIPGICPACRAAAQEPAAGRHGD
jgi:Fur family transcriptional regulator, ferric uptake regulator